MPRTTSLLAALVVTAALAAVPSTGEAATSPCQPSAPVRYRDAETVVWAQDAANAYVDFVVCWRATGRTTTAVHFDNDCISASGGCDDVRPEIRRVARAGRWRAMYVDNEVSNATIALVDARGGVVARVGGYVPREAPREIALGRDGTLAWISGYLSRRFERSRELRVCGATCRTSGGEARRLARGRRLSGLRLGAGRVVWTDGARRRSAPVD